MFLYFRIQDDLEQEQICAGLAGGGPGWGDSAPPRSTTQFKKDVAGCKVTVSSYSFYNLYEVAAGEAKTIFTKLIFRLL